MSTGLKARIEALRESVTFEGTEGEQRAAELEAFAEQLETKPPRSLLEVVRAYGYLSVRTSLLAKTQTPLVLDWVRRLRSPEILHLDPTNLIHGPRGKGLSGMAFVNNPGDVPGHFYAFLEEVPSKRGESLWCYIGFDTAHPDGVRLAPIATDFVALIQAVALGLTDALLLPKRKAASQQRAVEKIAKERAEDYREAIADVERSLAVAAGVDVQLAKKVDPEGSGTLELGCEAVSARLGSLSL